MSKILGTVGTGVTVGRCMGTVRSMIVTHAGNSVSSKNMSNSVSSKNMSNNVGTVGT